MSSLRLSVLKIMSKLSFGHKGNFRHMKTVSLDVPLSPETFQSKICDVVDIIDYSGEENFKIDVAPSQLNLVFGDNWSKFQFSSSSTQKRVLGLVTIHFRLKRVQILDAKTKIR